MQNFKTIGQLRNELWTNGIARFKFKITFGGGISYYCSSVLGRLADPQHAQWPVCFSPGTSRTLALCLCLFDDRKMGCGFPQLRGRAMKKTKIANFHDLWLSPKVSTQVVRPVSVRNETNIRIGKNYQIDCFHKRKWNDAFWVFFSEEYFPGTVDLCNRLLQCQFYVVTPVSLIVLRV